MQDRRLRTDDGPPVPGFLSPVPRPILGWQVL